MTAQTWYHIVLIIHLAGLTLLAGATLTDFVIFKQFWKQWLADKNKARGIQEGLSRLPMLIGIGAILLILSGVGMMALTKGVFGEQVWFRIKFVFVLLIILNGLLNGRRQVLQLRKQLSAEASGQNIEGKLLRIKTNLNAFHMTQFLFFTVIFVLSVFKFN